MAIATQKFPVLAGTAPTFATPLSSDTVSVGSTLIVKNASGASINVTFTTPDTLATGDAYPDKVYAVPAGQERWLPVLGVYMDPTTRAAAVAFSATTSVTVAAVVQAAI